MTVELSALKGTNPLGLFAALGVLDVLTRTRTGSDPVPRLWWSDEIEPTARLEGVKDLESVISQIDQDRVGWSESLVLAPTIDGILYDDVKLSTSERSGGQSLLRTWIDQVHQNGREADLALLYALVAEGATMGASADAKPTHFHFTAGQQKFLGMVRELRNNVTPDHFRDALEGPWRFDSPLPMLGWDTSRGDRIYALRGFNPASEKKLGVPGAEWLGFLGLRFFPVATRSVRGRAQLVTTGCAPSWKRGSFTWPVWGPGHVDGPAGLTAEVIQSLLADTAIVSMSLAEREAIGVIRVLTAPITRTDQGGYGSFGPPEEQTSGRDRVSAMVM